ncbi:hypothetical protein ED236_05215 [Pseudomethylobacillus aquaticus]|uniref:Uncharacterized protein n=1 Tax=Pseudomethylobacillus aquaticus TaxID=2676064 RepID=A0A3N0V2S1_9PROT|nr:hypothetical protein ED236_05215 [Pseudomethylobacillus aquaticus]
MWKLDKSVMVNLVESPFVRRDFLQDDLRVLMSQSDAGCASPWGSIEADQCMINRMFVFQY